MSRISIGVWYNVIMTDLRSFRRKGNDHRSFKRSYRIWQQMKDRCLNPNNPHKKYYGGRGITICSRWLEPYGKGYDNFIQDLGEPKDGDTLDRIDPDGDYCPENCRWADKWTQQWNKRRISSVGVRGITWDNSRRKYCAAIKSGKQRKIARFDSFEDALVCRKKWEKEFQCQE